MFAAFFASIISNPKNIIIAVLVAMLLVTGITLKIQNLRIDSFKKDIVLKDNQIKDLKLTIEELNNNITSLKQHNARLDIISIKSDLIQGKINSITYNKPNGDGVTKDKVKESVFKQETKQSNQKEGVKEDETNPVVIANSIINDFNSK